MLIWPRLARGLALLDFSADLESSQTSSSATAAPTPAAGWATVGSGGKVVPGASGPVAAPTPAKPTGLAALPPRPTMAPSSASPAPSSSSARAAPAARQPAPAKPVDEVPPPSLEFIRWMRDALRGLTGANSKSLLTRSYSRLTLYFQSTNSCRCCCLSLLTLHQPLSRSSRTPSMPAAPLWMADDLPQNS